MVERLISPFRAPATWGALLFSLQLVVFDLALRGARFYVGHPRALAFLVASPALLHLAISIERRPLRLAVAIGLAFVVTLQGAFFRYYDAPLDAQAGAAARLAWGDVRPVLTQALPFLTLVTLVLAAIEYAALTRLGRVARAPRRHGWIAATAFVLGVLVGGAPRDGTAEVRTTAALASFAAPRTAKTYTDHRPLPLLGSRRTSVPNVLFILTESVRAEDACGEGPTCGTSPELAELLPDRHPLLEMRSVSSYTAISLSALLTGLPQLGPRAPIASAPDLFDIVRATRSGGASVGMHYWSSHDPTFFERAAPERAVDSYLDGAMMLGRKVEDVEQEVVMGGLDRRLSQHCVDHISGLAPPYVAMVHFSGTHAPYYFDDATAPRRPFTRVVTWSGMNDLHRAYQDALLEQDRTIAACVKAFLDANRDRPYVVVYTSDHGESFGDHGAIHHGQHLYDTQIHVPAFVAAGGGALTTEETASLEGAEHAFVTHLDVLPTLLDLLGVLDHPALASDLARLGGQSLLRPRPTGARVIPITNCTEMWSCPLDVWGLLEGDRKLLAQAWDADWRCQSLVGGEHEIELARCADLVKASRGFYPLRPGGRENR